MDLANKIGLMDCELLGIFHLNKACGPKESNALTLLLH
jgi:hypothetical protein